MYLIEPFFLLFEQEFVYLHFALCLTKCSQPCQNQEILRYATI